MKIQLMILLFLAVSLSYPVTYSFLDIPAVSSARLPLGSASVIGLSAPDPPTIESFQSNITITGNLNLTGSSVVNLAGLSLSLPVNMSIYGSIFVNDNATLVLKYANVYIYGSIFVNDNATLVLEFVTLYFMGATGPYSRNIVLSSPNGHPLLSVTDASIIGVSGVASIRGRLGYGYGVAIYAYDESRVTGTGLSLSRKNINLASYTEGGTAGIICYGESSVSLSSVEVESMFTYDEANVTVYGGTIGPTFGGFTAAVLGVYNSSIVNLYGVSFPNTIVADNAHLVLSKCSELSYSMLTSTGHSRVDVAKGTTVAGFHAGSPPTFLPGINVTGSSLVYFSSSTASASANVYPVISVSDNATFVEQNGVIYTGTVSAQGDSNVFLNNTFTPGALANIEIIGSDSSNVSISDCSLSPNPRPVTIILSGGSYLHLVSSLISDGYFVFSDNSTVRISNTAITGSRITAEDNANLTVASGSVIDDSIEMEENASLRLESSTASLIYCTGSSKASFVNGSILTLSVGDSSTVRLKNSTVQELSLAESNVTGSLTGLTSFLRNSSLTFSGSRFQLSVLNTTIKDLDLSLSGDSKVTISNSTLYNLSLTGSCVVTLRNASIYAGPKALGNSIIFLYSSLRVRCVDYFGNPLNGSLVTVAAGPGGTTVLAKETTDKNGWASFVLFSGIVNATGRFPLGFATLTGLSGSASKSEDVNVAFVNKDVTLSLPTPSWSGYILPIVILAGVIVLLAFVSYAYKLVRARREKRPS